MAGLHDKRRTSESQRSKLLVRSRPDAAAAAAAAAPPPARRTMRAEVQVPSRKREHSVPAARVARSPRLPRGEQDSEDVAPAPPPPKPSRDWDPMDVTLAPPPAPRADAPPRTAYALRNRHVPGTSNRHVPDTSNRKPYIPARKEKRDELKHDRPCSSRKKLEQHEPWEAPSCARVGLEHYNSMNQGGEHELVEAVDTNSFIWGGGWLHANFLARPKDTSNCVDLVPTYFFAELKLDAFGLHCASCIKMDSVESKNLGSCGHCRGKIKHPATGGYLGAKARCQSAAATVDLYPSLFELQLHAKQLELLGSEEKLDGELDGW